MTKRSETDVISRMRLNSVLRQGLMIGAGLLLIVVSIVLFSSADGLKSIGSIPVLHAVASIVLAAVIYSLSGVQTRTLTSSSGIPFSWRDCIFFPITMGFWSFLIPFQGALLFSTIFFKSKYGRPLGTGLSIALFLYVVTVSLTGIAALLFVQAVGKGSVVTSMVLLSLVLLPVLLPLMHKLLVKLVSWKSLRSGLLRRVLNALLSVSGAVASMMRSPVLMLKMSALKVVKTLVVGVWYWVIAHGLGLEVGFLPLVLLSLVAELALIVKITPGNLGVNQLLSGATMSFMDFNPEWGVLISLVASGCALLLVFTVGAYGNHVFMRDHGIASIGDMLHSLRAGTTNVNSQS